MNGIGRSLRLLRGFRVEQTDPERFYRLLAADSICQVSRYLDLEGAAVLDVGGGPGWFEEAFTAAGARYVVVEPGGGDFPTSTTPASVMADGAALPFAGGSFDLCFSSNVLEHVPDPWAFLAELVRTARPGGIVFCAFTNWYSPWGGHETSPWHYVGGHRAADRYQRRFGHPPKNRFGHTLFPVHVGPVLRWAQGHPDVEVIDSRPRYYPDWCRFIVTLPAVREVATWNLALILRRR